MYYHYTLFTCVRLCTYIHNHELNDSHHHVIDRFSSIPLTSPSFVLPLSPRNQGEAQKIDKIMQVLPAHSCSQCTSANDISFFFFIQTFAAEYFKANTGLIENEDAAYILSFAIMMLHTSLHNPSVKHKTTTEQWVTMNRGERALHALCILSE